jgi:hypothetical protein
MTQKTLFLIAVLVVTAVIILGGVWYYFATKEEIVPIKIAEEEEEVTAVGYGSSAALEVSDAVAEAVSEVKMGLKGKTPDFVILFSTVGYDSEQVLRFARQILGERTQIYGGTSMLATITRDGWQQGEDGSLSMMGVLSPRITFGVGGADLGAFSTPTEAGAAAIGEAVKNVGQEGQKPNLILLTPAPGREEEIIAGIEGIVGADVPIIGGASGDNDLTGKWKQFANDKVLSNGVALAAVFTDLKIGWAYEAGYLRTENKGKITRAEGRVIYEIDNKPAAEVYNAWTGGIVSEKLKTGGTILAETTFWPLAKVIRKAGEIYYLSIHPLSVNLPNHSLTVFADVASGDEILLMRGDWELLLNRAQSTPAKAMAAQGFLPGKPLFGIYTYCAGTMLAIPEAERPKMPLLINNILGGVPFIGTFTFGEQGPLGEGNHHGNLVNSMILFGE